MHWCKNMMWRWCWLKPESIARGDDVYCNQVALFYIQSFWRLKDSQEQHRQNIQSIWSFMLLSITMQETVRIDHVFLADSEILDWFIIS